MTILLIEDDKRLADLIAYSLAGVKMIVAPSLATAHDILKTVRPHLMLVDLNLPDSGGLDTLMSLKPYVCPKVVLTAHLDLECQVAALGAVDYITKSSAMDEVMARIKFNVSKYRPRARFTPETFSEIKACLTRDRQIALA